MYFEIITYKFEKVLKFIWLIQYHEHFCLMIIIHLELTERNFKWCLNVKGTFFLSVSEYFRLRLCCLLQSCPFPFPLESARRFVQLQDVTPGAASICHLVALWAKDRAYLSSDKDYFATKAEELSVKTSTYLETNHVRHNEEDS